MKADVTGDLTIHGVTKQVTIPLDVQLTGGQGQVVGSLKFPFSDFGMSPPSVGGFVTVESDATLEFKLLLARGSDRRRRGARRAGGNGRRAPSPAGSASSTWSSRTR